MEMSLSLAAPSLTAPVAAADCIADLPDHLLQRVLGDALRAGGASGSSSIPRVCRAWHGLWFEDELWQPLEQQLGSPATRASALATRAAFGCGWPPALRAAVDMRRKWLAPLVLPVFRKEAVGASEGLTSLDCDAAFRRVAVGCFAQSVRVFALPTSSGCSGEREGNLPPSKDRKMLPGLDPLCSLPCHTDTVWDVRWHAADTQLISGSFDHTICVHDLGGAGMEEAGGSYRPLLTLTGHGDRVMGVLSCGSHLIASAGRDGTVRRWDVRTPGHRCVATLRDPEAQACAYTVAKSGSNDHTLLSGHDGTVAVWDCRTGKLVTSVAAHTRMVMDLQLDEDLGCLATASRDDTTKLWHWPSLECAAVFSGQVGVRSVQFDSDKIVTAANDRSVSVWKFPTAALAAAAERAQAWTATAQESEPEPELLEAAGSASAEEEEEEQEAAGSEDDGGGTQPRLRAITPPRTPPRVQVGEYQGPPVESLSPLRTVAAMTGTQR